MEFILSQLYLVFNAYPSVFFFLAPLIAGEVGVLFVAFLVSNAATSLVSVWGWGVLAMTLTDVFWFHVPRVSYLQRRIKNRADNGHVAVIKHRIDKVAHGRSFLILACAKLLVGVRIPFILLLGATSLTTIRFVGMAVVINCLWGAVLVLIGVLARRSFDFVLETLQNLQITLLIAGVVCLVLYSVYRRYKNTFLETG